MILRGTSFEVIADVVTEGAAEGSISTEDVDDNIVDVELDVGPGVEVVEERASIAVAFVLDAPKIFEVGDETPPNCSSALDSFDEPLV